MIRSNIFLYIWRYTVFGYNICIYSHVWTYIDSIAYFRVCVITCTKVSNLHCASDIYAFITIIVFGVHSWISQSCVDIHVWETRREKDGERSIEKDR